VQEGPDIEFKATLTPEWVMTLGFEARKVLETVPEMK
jgi:hypothetical protein